MTASAGEQFVSFKFFSKFAAVVAFLVGCSVLVGWFFDISSLKSILPGLASMKANTALMFILSGAALWMLNLDQASVRTRRLAQACALIVVAMGMLTLAEYGFGLDLGIDQLLFPDPDTPAELFPGRMSIVTALGFLLDGASILLLDNRWSHWLSAIPALAELAISTTAAIGYLYEAESLYRVGLYSSIPLPTTVAFVALCLGILFARAEREPMRILATADSGGATARRLIPILAAVTLIVGWLASVGANRGLYDARIERALGDVFFIALLTVIISWNARQLSAADGERKERNEKLQRQNQRLKALREIDMSILAADSVEDIVSAALSHIRELIDCRRASLALIDWGANEGLIFDVRQINQTSVPKGTRVPMALFQDMNQTLSKNQLVLINDLTALPSPLPLFQTAIEEGLRSVCILPLFWQNNLIGSFNMSSETPGFFDEEKINLGREVANQVAIAITQSDLLEALRQLNAELEQRVVERTAELNRTNAELEHANRAKDEFLANMSHELRTPLNSILGMSESLLEQKRDPLSERQQQSMQIIASSGRHLLELINDVLDLSKIEAGKFDHYPQIVDVDTLCRSSLSFVKEQAIQKSITLTYEGDEAVSRIYADPRRLKQILVNLLTNAVKFTSEHGQVTLEVHADEEQDLIQFSVIDNGIGIALEDLKLLFQPFVQVDSNLNRQFEGTGLGLALVQKLTDLHGGSVHVESEVDRGSRFTINLPWGKDIVAQQEIIESGGELKTNEALEKSLISSEGLLEHRSILLAEDNMANILTIGEYLESHGYEIANAHDGLEAIEKAEETNPDIILMDIQMPAMDGLEAIRRLRANPRFATTPIIALTALAMPGDQERCLEAGANEYLSKPVSLKTLVKMIQRLLELQG